MLSKIQRKKKNLKTSSLVKITYNIEKPIFGIIISNHYIELDIFEVYSCFIDMQNKLTALQSFNVDWLIKLK